MSKPAAPVAAAAPWGSGSLRRVPAKRSDPPQPLRAQDAFFVHEATPVVARQLGAVLTLDDAAAQIPLQRLADDIAAVITARAGTLPMLNRRLETPAGLWPRWVPAPEVTATEHLAVCTIDGGQASWHHVTEAFFGAPLPTDRPPWELALVREAGSGRTALLVKMHHALGDGLGMTETLVRLLSDTGQQPGIDTTASRRRRLGLRRRAARAATVLRGLISLAPVGLTPVRGLDGTRTSQRRYATVELPAAEVRAVAREHATSTSAVLLAVLSAALHRLLDKRGDSAADRQLRAMVPRSTRAARAGAEAGNWTAAVSLDLPVGPMSPARRLVEVTARLSALDRCGQPAAITVVLATLGRLPARLQMWLVGLISGRQFFDLIASVMPGARRSHRIAGARVSAVFPMIPLGRTGLAVGLMNWADVVGIGITADAGTLDEVDDFADGLRAAFDELRAAPSAPSVEGG